MADTRFANVRAGFTTVKVSGGFDHEPLGKADLIFTDTNLTFGDVVIAYDEMESPKLLIDRLFFLGHVRLDIVIGDKQFGACFALTRILLNLYLWNGRFRRIEGGGRISSSAT